jgi:hypothetical protein
MNKFPAKLAQAATMETAHVQSEAATASLASAQQNFVEEVNHFTQYLDIIRLLFCIGSP